MLQICRAEDGEVFQVDKTLWEIEREGSLELFLQRETGVDQEAVLAFLSDARRLRSDNLRELAGAHDETIYVFNKYYLEDEIQEVLRELYVDPKLQPVVEDAIASTPPIRHAQLAAVYLRAAHAHQDTIQHIVSSLQHQHEALRIASKALDLNILHIEDAFEVFSVNARRDLDRQATLLASVDPDLEAIGRTKVHPEFMSPTVRRAIEAGEKVRTLGDYVSPVKMRQVADGCMEAHNNAKTKFEQAVAAMNRLTEGGDLVRSTVTNSSTLEESDTSIRRVQDAVERITDSAALLESPASHTDGVLQELRYLDSLLRKEVESMTDLKNHYTETCIGTLRHISALNVDIVQLPTLMSSLQSDLRGKSSFPFIQRLHNMLYAYGATLVEIVRRKEFTRFFNHRSQNILEMMAKLSANERKRRQIYRGEVHGQLPFDTKGLDDSVLEIDFTPRGTTSTEYSLERPDVDAFLSTLDEIARTMKGNPQSIRETRESLEKLISRMDAIETSFDRVVERSLMSASRMSQSRRRLTDADEHVVSELQEQLRMTQQDKENQEVAFNQERDALYAEITKLKAENKENSDRADKFERDLHCIQAQLDSSVEARRIIEEMHSELTTEFDKLREGHANALAEASGQTKAAELVRRELEQAQAEFQELKDLEAKNSEKMARMLEEQTNTFRKLEEARSRGEDLQAQIHDARSENERVNQALKETTAQKDRLLRMQAQEHDRIMRDHIAEADGDRAVLEHQFSEAKALLDEKEQRLKEALAQVDILHADANGLREELQRTEHDLREAHHVERVLRDDLTTGIASKSTFEQRLDNSERLIAQILDVAITFRSSLAKALAALQPLAIHPNMTSRSTTFSVAETLLGSPRSPPGSITGPMTEDPFTIDPSDPAAALETLRAYNLDLFSETVGKVGSVMRRWQKQCKDYRERAKGKITFRNFAKGDLALFLPTRNSISKPWAAFNVSFPHYFLLATGGLAEQLKTREWIVARITSLTERVVDHRDPDSNPYGLGDGVKYYMLEVEDWTQPGSTGKRRESNRKVSDSLRISSSPPERPISPPPAETPDTAMAAADSLGATRSPTSHLFPIRTRANSATAGPSSLSRLLAQANPIDTSAEVKPVSPDRLKSASPPQNKVASPEELKPSASVSVPVEPVAPSSPDVVQPVSSTPEREEVLSNEQASPSPEATVPSPVLSAARQHSPHKPSPLRPGSRASSSSRLSFSGGRIPVFAGSASSTSPGTSKAAPTTALFIADQAPATSVPSSYTSTSTSSDKGKSRDDASMSTPSPTNSASDAIASTLQQHRRRTTSEHLPNVKSRLQTSKVTSSVGSSAASALATIASSWGLGAAISRRRKDSSLSTPLEIAPDFTDVRTDGDLTDSMKSPASELLRRL